MAPGRLFRMMFYDGDGCFSKVEYQAFDHALHDEINNRVLSHFMENRYFRFQLCKRYEELKHTYFSYDFMKSILDEYRSHVEGEVEDQYHRYHFPWSMNRYYADMEKADEFLRQRCQYFDEEMREYLDIEELAPVRVSCYPNPFIDEIRISFDAEQSRTAEIGIYDVLGRKVFAESCRLMDGANSFTICPKLPAGMYVLKVGGYTQRIVRL